MGWITSFSLKCLDLEDMNSVLVIGPFAQASVQSLLWL